MMTSLGRGVVSHAPQEAPCGYTHWCVSSLVFSIAGRGPDCPPEGGPCPPVAVESAGTAEEGQCGNEQGSSTGETVPSVLSEDVMASGFSAGARKSLSHGEDAAVAMQVRAARRRPSQHVDVSVLSC